MIMSPPMGKCLEQGHWKEVLHLLYREGGNEYICPKGKILHRIINKAMVYGKTQAKTVRRRSLRIPVGECRGIC